MNDSEELTYHKLEIKYFSLKTRHIALSHWEWWYLWVREIVTKHEQEITSYMFCGGNLIFYSEQVFIQFSQARALAARFCKSLFGFHCDTSFSTKKLFSVFVHVFPQCYSISLLRGNETQALNTQRSWSSWYRRELWNRQSVGTWVRTKHPTILADLFVLV